MRTSLAAILLLASISLAQQPDDLLIRGGKIIDGTGNAFFYADIAIRDGKIAAIGDLRNRKAQRSINAAELVVAPGFIDVHTHIDDGVLKSPQAENFVRDGVTTAVCGNCGGSVLEVADFFSRMRQRGAAINLATLVGHNSILTKVKGNKKGELTSDQLAQAKEIVRKAMRQGAVGLSTGLIYTPGEWSNTEEIIELMKPAAELGGIYATHMRSEGSEILAAIDEALRVGREAGCRVEISHFKLSADTARKIGGSNTTLAKVLAARAAGQEVWLDQYPYAASSTTISTMLPDWVLENGRDAAHKTLADPEQVKRILVEMSERYEKQRGFKSLAYVNIAACKSFPEIVGRDLAQAAETLRAKRDPAATGPVTMEDQYRAVIDIVLAGGASCVFHSQSEDEVANIMKNPLVAIASDSGIRDFGVGAPHPRGYGTNARVLGQYVREKKLITLEDAIRKMTGLPALAFRFRDRGLLREGFAADITIFDPNAIIDRSTFEQPHQYSEGVHYVIVNGRIVLEEAKLTGALPGQPIEGPALPRAQQ